MEHLDHFGLSGDPFCNELDLSFFYESEGHRDVQRRMERSIRQAKGLTVLTGPDGSGKSLLARRLFEGLEETTFEVVLMVMLPGATDARAVLGRLARELGVENPGEDRSSILGHIYEQLVNIREAGRKFVLVIDEAQILRSEALSEIGGLLSLEHEQRRLLSLLLVGSSELDRCLDEAGSLRQRVDVRVRLEPLNLEETKAYIDHRIDRVGGKEGFVATSAIDALFKSSGGRPRLLNTLADNALFEAYLRGAAEVAVLDVDRAAADLSPAPETESTARVAEAVPIAFPAEGSGGVEPLAEGGSSMPSGTSPTAIGRLELIDEASPLFMDEPMDEAPLDLADEDLLSIETDEPAGSLPESEVLADRTMDLEVEWIPEAGEEYPDGKPFPGIHAESDQMSMPDNSELASVAVGDGSPGSFDAGQTPGEAEERFLDLLED